MGKTLLNLGRYGDVIALLPVLKKEYDDTGEKPSLIISKDYADILDGVSYVDPVVYQGKFEDISGALKFAEGLGSNVTTTQVVGVPDVVVSQVYGNNHSPKIICDSFQKDLWRLANKLDLLLAASLPPMIPSIPCPSLSHRLSLTSHLALMLMLKINKQITY